MQEITKLTEDLAHLSRKLTMLAYRMVLEPASVCECVCVFTFPNMNISEASWSIAIRFYLNHHWRGGNAALGFGPDGIRTLVSMATDSFHSVMVGEML